MDSQTSFAQRFLKQICSIASQIDLAAVERIAVVLSEVRAAKGRLFCLGVGGGAGHASHAVNDFRKIACIESYSPTDNVSELTARINDDGWDTSFSAWLRGSHLCRDDAVFVFSVGGGSVERRVSVNIVRAVDLARSLGARVLGIVGRDGGYTALYGDAVVIIPTVDPSLITPHTEAFQAVIWHLLVSHPVLALRATKWESATDGPSPIPDQADGSTTGP
jgi:D-sedoheptulose 7-phosphate isomerase